MRRGTLGVALLGLVLVVAAAACGGGGKKGSSEPPTSTAQPEEAMTATTTVETTTKAATGGSFGNAKDCAQLASLAAKVQQSVTPTSNGSVAMAREADALAKLANAAPKAIKGDLQTFAEAFASFAKVYSDSGFKAGSTPTAAQLAKLTAASRKLATPKVQAAISHLDAWGRSHCGGLTTTTP